ncbi:MAG: hypothetical protein GDA49_06480 [Rhodospirillales bacterium]|nr:hypothetical protein [Rhodospirillales bacterium]
MKIEAFRIGSVLGRGISLYFRNLTRFLPVLLATSILLAIVIDLFLNESMDSTPNLPTLPPSSFEAFIDVLKELVNLLGNLVNLLIKEEVSSTPKKLVNLIVKFFGLQSKDLDSIQIMFEVNIRFMAISFFLSGGITYGVVSLLHRGEADGIKILIQSLKNVLRLLFLIVVLLIGSIIVMVPFFLLTLMVPIIGPIAAWALLLWLFVLLWVVLPAAVVEKINPFPSMGRSIALTKGYRWKVLAIIIAIIAVSLAVFAIFYVLFFVTIFITLFVFEAVGALDLIRVNFFSITIILVFPQLIGIGVLASVAAVSYHDLRVLKEGVGTEQIAQQFD